MFPTRSLAALLIFFAVSGCQCLEPVAEGADSGVADADGGAAAAGTDGGAPDGGFMSDGGVECEFPRDCAARGVPWSDLCFGEAPGFSCIAGRCVSECADEAPRTCAVDAGGDCLECTAVKPLCNADTCPTSAFIATVSATRCRAGVVSPLYEGDKLSFVPVHGASCELSVSGPRGGLGQVIREGHGRHFWFIRELGGWCVGEPLPTGILSSLVACPQCSFVVEQF